jgi:hypothetical protein
MPFFLHRHQFFLVLNCINALPAGFRDVYSEKFMARHVFPWPQGQFLPAPQKIAQLFSRIEGHLLGYIHALHALRDAGHHFIGNRISPFRQQLQR